MPIGGTSLFILLVLVIASVYYLVKLSIKHDSLKRRAAQFEESRREIAAYVAEGSITPETAEMLLRTQPGDLAERAAKAGCDDDDEESPDTQLAQAMEWGTVKRSHAEELIASRATMNDAQWKKAVALVCEGMKPAHAMELARGSGQAAGARPAYGA